MTVRSILFVPGAGALKLDGLMLDIPHLKQAKRVLAMSEQLAI